MSDARAISGTYADLKFIKTRSVCQIVVEIPIENADSFLKMFGAPQPGKEVPVALARLTSSPRSVPVKGNNAEAKLANAPGNDGIVGETKLKDRKPFNSLPLSQQAAIRCTDRQFWKWLGVQTETGAACAVRERCGVATRADIQEGAMAGTEWMMMEDDFKAWLTDNAYAESIR